MALQDTDNFLVQRAGASYRETALSMKGYFGGGSAGQATETTPGIAELATQDETDAGTDDLRIVTPLKLSTFVSQNLWIDGGSSTSNFGSAPAIIDGGAAA